MEINGFFKKEFGNSYFCTLNNIIFLQNNAVTLLLAHIITDPKVLHFYNTHINN
jgi:hypothetical protein